MEVVTSMTGDELASDIAMNLPYLRRYARALTGDQDLGDGYAAQALEAILSDQDSYASEGGGKASLFKVFHGIWKSSGAIFVPGTKVNTRESRAREHLAQMTPHSREALLLKTVEEFSTAEVARIMAIAEDVAEDLLSTAFAEMAERLAGGRVLIIEDEAIIALDLETIVEEMGHSVIGVARTADAALRLAAQDPFDLILSDIQLADNSSGIDAVNKILKKRGDCPVIFITAFPERLLTGQGPEPAFLISKPYNDDQVKSAVSQAMFFASTEEMSA